MTKEVDEQETNMEETMTTSEQEGNMEHAEEGLYEFAEWIADEKGIKLSDAIVEAATEMAPEVSKCTEKGFKNELRRVGITPPDEFRWLFRVLDELPPEAVEGTKLAPYAEARAKAKQICGLLAAAEEALEQD